eukprot:scaffold294741_cov37-Tisochrysis_lutea.AAC.3
MAVVMRRPEAHRAPLALVSHATRNLFARMAPSMKESTKMRYVGHDGPSITGASRSAEPTATLSTPPAKNSRLVTFFSTASAAESVSESRKSEEARE